VAQDLSNPQYVFYTKLLTAMFHGTPYENDALGSRPSFDKTTGDDAAQVLRHLVCAEQRDHGDCGDVDPQQTLAR
jgi:zinc protease